MASAVFPAECLLPLRGQAIRRSTTRPKRGIAQWPWHAIADAASGIALLGLVAWVAWCLGGPLLQMVGMIEAQAVAGIGGPF